MPASLNALISTRAVAIFFFFDSSSSSYGQCMVWSPVMVTLWGMALNSEEEAGLRTTSLNLGPWDFQGGLRRKSPQRLA
jgi:hypothetical protein